MLDLSPRLLLGAYFPPADSYPRVRAPKRSLAFGFMINREFMPLLRRSYYRAHACTLDAPRIAAESRVLLAHVVVASVGEGIVASSAAGKLASQRDHRVNSSASARIMKMSIADTSAPTGCRAQVAVCSVMMLAGVTGAMSSSMVAALKAKIYR
jgi:hypothetical protein